VIETSEPASPAGVPEEKVLHFPNGIPGFPAATRFALTDLDEAGTFQVLQSLDDPELSFVVCVPWMLFPDYSPEIDEDVRTDLDLDTPEDAFVFCSVTVEGDAHEFYVNLLGPFVANVRTRRARQVVLADQDLPVRAAVKMDA
jgi:flagellar assembly factor FliW